MYDGVKLIIIITLIIIIIIWDTNSIRDSIELTASCISGTRVPTEIQ